jgi:stage II sporulation protein P
MAEELSEVLGVPSIHASTVHDWPDWTLSYSKSLKTMTSLVKSYSSLRAVVDIHRDSLPANREKLKTAMVGGEKVARVLFVVTDDSSGLAHPNWRKNYHFALELSAEMDKMYPGVSRGVAIVKNARFNQHVHPGAIILEIGGTDNTVEGGLQIGQARCAGSGQDHLANEENRPVGNGERPPGVCGGPCHCMPFLDSCVHSYRSGGQQFVAAGGSR